MHRQFAFSYLSPSIDYARYEGYIGMIYIVRQMIRDLAFPNQVCTIDEFGEKKVVCESGVEGEEGKDSSSGHSSLIKLLNDLPSEDDLKENNDKAKYYHHYLLSFIEANDDIKKTAAEKFSPCIDLCLKVIDTNDKLGALYTPEELEKYYDGELPFKIYACPMNKWIPLGRQGILDIPEEDSLDYVDKMKKEVDYMNKEEPQRRVNKMLEKNPKRPPKEFLEQYEQYEQYKINPYPEKGANINIDKMMEEIKKEDKLVIGKQKKEDTTQTQTQSETQTQDETQAL